jgi:hypothetical protein
MDIRCYSIASLLYNLWHRVLLLSPSFQVPVSQINFSDSCSFTCHCHPLCELQSSTSNRINGFTGRCGRRYIAVSKGRIKEASMKQEKITFLPSDTVMANNNSPTASFSRGWETHWQLTRSNRKHHPGYQVSSKANETDLPTQSCAVFLIIPHHC